MKNTRINTPHNTTITDTLIELVHTVSQHGTLVDLSDDQLDAIVRPNSLVSFVMLLNVVDKASQATILAQLDIDYLLKHCILNHQQLGVALKFSPLLAKCLLENNTVLNEHCNTPTKLVEIIEIAPQYAAILLAKAALIELIVENSDIAKIMNSAPDCASILVDYLCANIRGGDDYFSDILFAAPQLCEVVLNNPKCVIDDAKILVKIIVRTPRSADILLARSEMLGLIERFAHLLRIIECVPHWASRLLSNPELRKLIIEAVYLGRLMKVAPHYAAILCDDAELLALIKDGDDLALIIENAPQLATSLLSDLKLRGLIQTGAHIKRILKAAPKCINPFLSAAQIKAFFKITAQLPNLGGAPGEFLHSFRKYEAVVLWDTGWQLATLSNLVLNSKAELSKAAAIFNNHMMKLARALWDSKEVDDYDKREWLPYLIQAIPECADPWLTNPKVIKYMDPKHLLHLLEAGINPDSIHYNNIMKELRSHQGDCSDGKIMRALKKLPSLADVFLECNCILYCIDAKNLLEAFLIASPRSAEILLRRSLILVTIQDSRKLLKIIKLAPQYAKELLMIERLRAFINDASEIIDVITTAPDCAEILLEDKRLCQLITPSALYMFEILRVAPQCANSLFWNSDVLLTPAHLAIYLDVNPVEFLQMIPMLSEKPDATTYLTTGAEIATFLTLAPTTLPLLYPMCYLLKKTTDIVRVLCEVAIDNVWDLTAKLPAIHGNVLWPIGAQSLTNTLLNELMCELEKIGTPRSRLMQAYLLIHTARELDMECLENAMDEKSIAIFKQLKKTHHDALAILESLYQREPTLLSAVKFLLIQIEAMHVTHVTLLDEKEKSKGNRALRSIM
ncbi:MAG: type VI secretion system baseplate subunit TssG, partial [Pseudomonadota bacterium]|nr:type VI secretion system baseplate subunit TssG [Pseudomonadota bacterium]